jgi:hypothetical protein
MQSDPLEGKRQGFQVAKIQIAHRMTIVDLIVERVPPLSEADKVLTNFNQGWV